MAPQEHSEKRAAPTGQEFGNVSFLAPSPARDLGPHGAQDVGEGKCKTFAG